MNTNKKTAAPSGTYPAAVAGLPPRIWMVIRPSGERDYMHREPLEGWAEWTRRLDARVVEYTFGSVIYTPPLKKTVPPKP